MNELALIAALRDLPLHPGARELADDAAVLAVGGETLVLTHDAMAEGVHFRAGADMADVAWKLVASNLSDLAAKGAEPVGVLLGYTLGRDDTRFLDGLRDVLEAYAVPLLGGDTIAAEGPRTFGLTAVGRATHTPVPSRSGARLGDALWLCGGLGHAMLGFEGAAEHKAAFDRPMPLIEQGIALAPIVTAMMDVSDGLLLDAARMANASGVTMALDSAAMPVADPARLLDCLTWGDDYALLFTAPPEAVLPIAATRIGTVRPASGTHLLVDGQPPEPGAPLGYTHR